MKPIKMFGFVALAALMAMAFVGASAAMAEDTSLCSNDSAESCTAVTHVHETSVSKAKLLTTFLTIECDVLFLGNTSPVREESSAAVVEGEFIYTNCGSCTVTEENGPAEIKVLREGHETASVIGEKLVKMACGESFNCSYNGVGLKGTAKGPLLSTQKNGEVSLVKQSLNKEAGGFLCPEISRLDITTTPLAATYIAKALHYCLEYQGAHGFYSNSTCTAQGSRTNKFMLVVGPAGLTVGTTLCAKLGPSPHTGLYLDRACIENSPFAEWLYEEGTIKTVQ